MVILMTALLTMMFAQCVQDGVVGGGYLVNDAFVQECLQRTVNRYPVEGLPRVLFNIGMGQGALRLQEQMKNPAAAFRYAQAFPSQYVEMFLHLHL